MPKKYLIKGNARRRLRSVSAHIMDKQWELLDLLPGNPALIGVAAGLKDASQKLDALLTETEE